MPLRMHQAPELQAHKMWPDGRLFPARERADDGDEEAGGEDYDRELVTAAQRVGEHDVDGVGQLGDLRTQHTRGPPTAVSTWVSTSGSQRLAAIWSRVAWVGRYERWRSGVVCGRSPSA